MTTSKKKPADSRPLLPLLEKEMGSLTFGMFLRAARTALALSQTEMAKQLGLTKGTLCDIEKGRQLVSPTLAHRIAKKVGLSPTLAVKACLQDQLNKAKIKMKVDLSA
jgi:DNA-binding XRE family transcriptional regulator